MRLATRRNTPARSDQVENPPRLVLSAFGIHTGGALVLLDALVEAAASRIGVLYADARIAARLATKLPHARVIVVQPTVPARLKALRRVSGDGRAHDRLLCFNNLPPLGRSAARTIVYLHNIHLAGSQPGSKDHVRERLRFAFERTMLRLARKNADVFWVQTPTTRKSFATAALDRPIEIKPFCANAFGVPQPDIRRSMAFVYPAGADPHKNHVRLFQAWRLLDAQGCRPALSVFMSNAAFAARLSQAGLNSGDLPHLDCPGELSHGETLARIASASALIFPSIAETFGLPLIEAYASGTPIIASERDFVRDVCVPVQTFDPLSPRSIADAVLRFLGAPRPLIDPLSPATFVDAIFA